MLVVLILKIMYSERWESSLMTNMLQNVLGPVVEKIKLQRLDNLNFLMF